MSIREKIAKIINENVCFVFDDSEKSIDVADEILHEIESEELRDKFAGQALTGILSNSDTITFFKSVLDKTDYKEGKAVAAAMAYKLADAMLAERNKE